MALLSSCGNNTETDAKTDTSKLPAFASTYAPLPSETTLITNARIIDGTGPVSYTHLTLPTILLV